MGMSVTDLEIEEAIRGVGGPVGWIGCLTVRAPAGGGAAGADRGHASPPTLGDPR